MELSVQKKINLKLIQLRRSDMIEREGLHMQDMISYERFIELHKKYGNDYPEDIFARYFLDIFGTKLYYIKIGKSKETPILTKEYISKNYLDELRNTVQTELKSRGTLWISYKRIVDLHSRYGGKLSIYRFAEEVLNINVHNIENLKSKGNSARLKLYDDVQEDDLENFFSRDRLEEIRNQVLEKSKLHIDEQITLKQFKSLHKKFGHGMPERLFANKILDINNNNINRLLRGSFKTTSVFSSYVINPEDIMKLREKVIRKEKLHIGDIICHEDFIRMYRKYSGLMSQEMFAEEILDINAIGVKNMRVSGINAEILHDIEVPKEYLQYLKTKIVKKAKLSDKQEITLEQFNELYEKYGTVLPKFQFGIDVLGISQSSISNLLLGKYKKVAIFSSEEVIDFQALRKKVIKENNLHYSDGINYGTFSELKQKYAPNMPERIFADKILDISQKRCSNIRLSWKHQSQNRGFETTPILLKEPLPSEKDWSLKKRKVLIENKLHVKDTIKYEKVKELYEKYGGIEPDYIFTEKILDISKSKLKSMKIHPDEEAIILTNTKFSLQALSELKNQIFKKYPFKERDSITLEQFQTIYREFSHILSELMFAKAIFGITKSDLGNLKSQKIKAAKLFKFSPEQLAKEPWISTETFTFDEDETIAKPKKSPKTRKITGVKTTNVTTRKQAEKILDDYIYTPTKIEQMKSFILDCKRQYQEGTFQKSDLDFLAECIEFAQGRIKGNYSSYSNSYWFSRIYQS